MEPPSHPSTPPPPPSGPPPSPPAASTSNQAMWSLILGILGIICCGLLAPIAWYMGKKELEEIRAGRSPASNEGQAKAGMILGIVGTILLILGIIWIFFMGGMAILSGAMGGAGMGM